MTGGVDFDFIMIWKFTDLTYRAIHMLTHWQALSNFQDVIFHPFITSRISRTRVVYGIACLHNYSHREVMSKRRPRAMMRIRNEHDPRQLQIGRVLRGILTKKH